MPPHPLRLDALRAGRGGAPHSILGAATASRVRTTMRVANSREAPVGPGRERRIGAHAADESSRAFARGPGGGGLHPPPPLPPVPPSPYPSKAAGDAAPLLH